MANRYTRPPTPPVQDRLRIYLAAEINRLAMELRTIEEEIRLLEEKYGVKSSELLEMLEGKRKWTLPEGAEPDVVEWEALIAIREKLKNKLKEVKELWNQLQG